MAQCDMTSVIRNTIERNMQAEDAANKWQLKINMYLWNSKAIYGFFPLRTADIPWHTVIWLNSLFIRYINNYLLSPLIKDSTIHFNVAKPCKDSFVVLIGVCYLRNPAHLLYIAHVMYIQGQLLYIVCLSLSWLLFIVLFIQIVILFF